ncbi:HNH endonuclease [Flavobacterium sp. WW92]|uniref:HNH endonuclease n=1 Tax=unclassified Flavobacterium TaxID=196869 RepID=UPI002223F48F|nr:MULTISPECIES: HNH endonuclease [unclassified Flavobacterium]WDO13950.1 HNH endonuclease [Flavobacterium sp. WW92]
MKNPDWTRDELILALNLYFELQPREITAMNSKIIEMSKILNSLPIHDNTLNESFRNPNGVNMKLNNFKRFDKEYFGIGLKRGAKLDEMIWNEFVENRQRLGEIANAIKSISKNTELVSKISSIPSDEGFDESRVALEGKIIYKLHKLRERDRKIIAEKKKSVLKINNKLSCEVCNLNFEEKYGEIGKGFIECHHKVPLSSLKVETKITVKDLALVCSNCHRMLHRDIKNISVEKLKELIK